MRAAADGTEPSRGDIVQAARAKLADHITLAVRRYGTLTELETPAAARIYIERTEEQRFAAAVQRRDYGKQKSVKRARELE